jgi:hypothetical protein
MNRKENFIKYLTDSTINGGIIWENIRMPSSVSRCITNPDTVSHVYSSDKQENDIYLIVQKYWRYSSDLEQYYEQFSKFLLVFDNNYLVYSIYEGEVLENMFDVLLDKIQEKQGNIFYEKFMKNVPGYMQPEPPDGPMLVEDNDCFTELRFVDDNTGKNIDLIPSSQYRVEDDYQWPKKVNHEKKERDNPFLKIFRKGASL